MRLLLLTNDFPNPLQPTKGVFNLQMAQALAQRHDVRVISPLSWLDESRAGKARRGLGHHRQWTPRGVRVTLPRYYYPPRVLRNQYGRFLWRSVRKISLDMVAADPPDAVLGYWAHPDGEVALRLAREAGVAGVVMVGGSDILVLAREQPRRRRMIVEVLTAADAVVAVSEDLKRRTIDLGVPAEKVQVVYRGVDRELFTPGDRHDARRRLGLAPGRPMVLWVGRMVPVKGCDVLLDACAALFKRGVAFQLHLVGDGELRPALEARCGRLGVSGNVSFAGEVPHAKLADWFRAAEVTVLPSRSEGVPNALLESIACGTPFVASGVGGIPEIADERYDRLVAPGDAAALAEAISSALAYAAGSPRSFEPRRFEPRGWADSARELEQLLERLVYPTPRDLGKVAPSGGYRTVRSNDRRAAAVVRQWLRRGMTVTLPRRLFLTRGPAKSGAVCLTFDDGPHPEHTPRLLDVLAAHGVRATFFLIGQRAAAYPELVRRIAAEGHAIGHHSYFHRPPNEAPPWYLLDGIQRTQRLFEKLLGAPSHLFRPPYGKLTPGKLWRLWRARQSVVLWNADPKDYSRQSAAEVARWLREHPLHSGDVVLMHDTFPFAAEVLPEVIAEARSRGLVFDTVEAWTGRGAGRRR